MDLALMLGNGMACSARMGSSLTLSTIRLYCPLTMLATLVGDDFAETVGLFFNILMSK